MGEQFWIGMTIGLVLSIGTMVWVGASGKKRNTQMWDEAAALNEERNIYLQDIKESLRVIAGK